MSTKNRIRIPQLKRSGTVQIVAVFVAGIFVGLLGSYGIQTITDKPTKSKQTSAQLAPLSKVQQESQQKRLDRRLKIAQARIAKDAEAGRLTEQQASLINAKLIAITEYQKSHIGQSASEKKSKRKEWRKWAEQNNVPTAYISQIL